MRAVGVLSPKSISAGLPTTFVGKKVAYHCSVTSTMDIARQLAGDGAPAGTVVIAEEQTAGRGRFGRSWLAPAGSSLLLSIVLRPPVSVLPRLTIVASLAVAGAIEETTGLAAKIKWPNDVMISGKKVCGVIVEGNILPQGVVYSVVGIGLNVNFDASKLAEIETTATSLMAELNRPVSRLRVLRGLLCSFEHYYTAVEQGKPIHLDWERRLETIGQPVRVSGACGIEEGRAEAVDEEGALLVRRDDGSLSRILAGDVTLRS